MSEPLQSNLNVYKYCFVPNCKNTSFTAPQKQFISVPQNAVKRKAWCESAGCPEKRLKSSSYCCEDHFDVSKKTMVILCAKLCIYFCLCI